MGVYELNNWGEYWKSPQGREKRRKIAKRKNFFKKNPELKPGNVDPLFPRTKYMKVYLSQSFAYRMCFTNEKYGYYKIHKYIRYPEERYELKDKEIIRTVSTFHFISKHTTINGICNSFCDLLCNTMITGEEEIYNIPDSIIKEFRKRYKVGRFREIDYSKSDLDMKIRCIKVIINRVHYFIITVKTIEGEWGTPKLFRVENSKQKELNLTIEPYMSQEQIIGKIKKGEITKISKYGNPKIIYNNIDVLNIIT